MIAGGLGVAFQAMVSHRLQPADYGSVFAVISLITLIGLPASALTLLVAREASQDKAVGQYAASTSLLRQGNRALLLGGIGLGALLAITSPIVAAFLAVPSTLVMAAAAGMPFGLAVPLLLGEFQGEQRFLAFALMSAGQALLKLGGALVLGQVWGAVGIIVGISAATALVYLIGLSALRRKLAIKAHVEWWPRAAAYLRIVIPSTLAVAVLLNADVLLVKHYFPVQSAGEYSSVAALGRAIFWGATGVAAVLFPKVITRRMAGRDGAYLVAASVALVAIGGVLGLAALLTSSRWLLTTFSGSAYVDAAQYLPWYAIGMTTLGGTAVLTAAHQTTGKALFLAVLLPLAALEPVLIATFHRTLLMVVQVLDLSMALTFVGLASLYVADRRASIADSGARPAEQTVAVF